MSPPGRPRAKDAGTIAIEIDHREVTCPEGVSVLRAAELNGIQIPSLCSHKDLSPFGGCRLCMVEISGMRGYPLACSTIVQEGMKILTETTALFEMRREILELILSEHPSSCLICTEKEECRSTLDTIRKSGVSTGCRYCPNDGQCDLQSLVERFDITEIHYPILYHGYESEHDDPFFDRDYNLCILCGRCVRMCQEVRGTSVLAFKYRGPKTRIGPAFGRNHVQAGCEFCGACVSVCPTGALAEKASKWDGKPDGSIVSTCPFCALGCRIDLKQKNGSLSRVEAHHDPEINDGQLCVRGAFCLPETTHHHDRARKPIVKRGTYRREVGWPEALEEAAARLQGVRPEEILMLVSPDLTNENLYAAQKFVRSCLKSNGIDSTARWSMPGGSSHWARLFALPISIREIADADSIIAIGLDTRFSFSIAGVRIRQALREGARLVAIDSRESNLARSTDHWLCPKAGTEGVILEALAASLLGAPERERRKARAAAVGAGVQADQLDRAIEAIAAGRDLAVVVGPSAFALDQEGALARALLRLGEREHTCFLPLYHGANTRGVLELGALGEWLPGPVANDAPGLSLADLLSGKKKPRVLYLVGEVPMAERPDCECVIAQDIYRPPFEVDIFFPASSFAEAEGTLTNIEGRIQEIARVEEIPDGSRTGFARPDWHIFGALAERLGDDSCRFDGVAAIRREISERVMGFPPEPVRKPRQLRMPAKMPRLGAARASPDRAPPGYAAASGSARGDGRRLAIVPGGFRHRGIDLSGTVEGLSELRLEDGFRMNPADLEELGIDNGGQARIRVDGKECAGPVRSDPDCPRGMIELHRPFAYGGLAAQRDLETLHRIRGNLHSASATPERDRPEAGGRGR